MRRTLLIPVLMLLGSAPLLAAELKVSSVPADAKWVVHIDADGLRQTKLWGLIEPKLKENADFQNKLATFELLTGMTFPRDLHDVTISSPSFDEKEVTVTVGADVNQAQINQLLSTVPGYATSPHDKFEVLGWHDQDKDRQMYGAFFSANRLIVSQSQEQVIATLDATAEKVAGLAEPSPLAAKREKGTLISIFATDLTELIRAKDPNSPLIGQFKAATIALFESGDNAIVKASVTAPDAATADQMGKSIEGIKAMVTLTAAGQAADPKLKDLAGLLGTSKVTVKEAVVSVEWPVPVAKLSALFDKYTGGAAAAPAPPADPAPKP